MTFADWIDFEATRIVSMGLRLPEEHRADYIRFKYRLLSRRPLVTVGMV
jgi:hypothetical protein